MKIKSKINDYVVSFYFNIDLLIKSLPDQNVIWVVDNNVLEHWGSKFPQKRIVFFSDEKNKSFEKLPDLINCFVAMNVKKSTTIIAVGGGTLQDAVGFVCSIYNRGINWILVPTTLLSQADSCIGGKTSCNYHDKKNILGTFYPPTEVKICKDFLSTLSPEQYSSGMGEVVKFYTLKNELHLMSSNTEASVRYSLAYKKQIIETDEFDNGERVFLNFGHTFGHAIESVSKYKVTHGIAVLVGMLIANRYAVNINILSCSKEQEIKNAIKPLINCHFNRDWFGFNDLLHAIKSDKKNTNTINMVLLTDIGEWTPILKSVQDLSLLEQSLKEVCNEII